MIDVMLTKWRGKEMSKILLYQGQRCSANRLTWVATIVLTGSALCGQSSADSIDFRMALREPTPRASSNIVTIQELRHVVPEKARIEMEKAEKARVKHRTEEAIAHFHQAALIDPELAAARNNFAALSMATNPALAVDELQEAVTIDPHNPLMLTNLTLGYVMLRKLDAAERAARLAVGVDRTSEYARLLLGVVLVDQQKFTEEALECLKQASEYPLAHILAARVLVMQGSLQKARSEIQMYLSSGDRDNRALATRWLDQINRNEQMSAAVLPD